MQTQRITPKQFLGAFFDAGDEIYLRIFADRKDQPFTGMKLRTNLELFDGLLPQLQAHNDRQRGIFFVVNAGDATAEDVRNLIAHVQATVQEKFGVALEPEVRMWGFHDTVE